MAEKTGESSTEKLQHLREKLGKSRLDAYLVPRADEWQGEYVPARAERLSWLTGFNGSAGMALVTKDKAAVFSDDRYGEQLKKLDKVFDGRVRKDANNEEHWLLKNVPQGGRVGYDPRLHTVSEIDGLKKKLAGKKIRLKPVEGNLIDAIWDDQPDHPADKAVIYPEKYAGKPSADKRRDVAGDIKKTGAQAVLLTQPDSIAWLLNIRGSDVPHVPVVLSYALVHKTGKVDWFVPKDKVTAKVAAHLGKDIKAHDLDDMPAVLQKRAARGQILLDESSAAVWFKTFLQQAGAKPKHIDDPVVPRKAIKNEAERKHIRAAHIKDGVALVKFWKWIDETAPKGGLDEMQAVEKLHDFRRQQGAKDDSFDAIVGWAGNGADIHYRPNEADNRVITRNNLLLVDSGGQYPGGTTDNTRTRAIGKPTQKMREHFTRVLKGHIAIADTPFRAGTTGRDMDMLARQFLNKAGINCPHGIGHGVGSYLSVHEGGTGIHGKMTWPLKPGMLVSNEPGYYVPGKYGIRLENLVLVVETGDDQLKYKFNTVSLTPFDRNLIDIDLLDADEIRWLNEYHREVYDKLSPHLDKAEKAWLKKETAPIRRGQGPRPS